MKTIHLSSCNERKSRTDADENETHALPTLSQSLITYHVRIVNFFSIPAMVN